MKGSESDMCPQPCLNLYPYNEALTHTIIISFRQLNDYIWIELPHNISKYLSLDAIAECREDGKSIFVDFKDFLEREDDKPWLKVKSDMFNIQPGYHMYKFTFSESRIDSEISLYLTYQIQTDDPNKSYIYMKREDAVNG